VIDRNRVRVLKVLRMTKRARIEAFLDRVEPFLVQVEEVLALHREGHPVEHLLPGIVHPYRDLIEGSHGYHVACLQIVEMKRRTKGLPGRKWQTVRDRALRYRRLLRMFADMIRLIKASREPRPHGRDVLSDGSFPCPEEPGAGEQVPPPETGAGDDPSRSSTLGFPRCAPPSVPRPTNGSTAPKPAKSLAVPTARCFTPPSSA
jgi:hypothetical protein